MPLVAQRLADNVAALCHGVAYVLVKQRYAACQLPRNARDELARMADIAATSREEEAGSKALPVEVPTGDCARNRRLSRAC